LASDVFRINTLISLDTAGLLILLPCLLNLAE
jgi:hypothetical protein